MQRVAVEFAPSDIGAVYEARYSWDTLRPYTVFSVYDERVWRAFRIGPIEERHIDAGGKAHFFIWIDSIDQQVTSSDPPKDTWWPHQDRQRKTDPEWDDQELMVKVQLREKATAATEADSWWSEPLFTRLYYWGVQPDVYWVPNETVEGGRVSINRN